MAFEPLKPDDLYSACDPELLPFETTAELEELTEVLGQPRAVEAIEFGTSIRSDGYNLFVHGPSGTGRHTTVTEFLNRRAATEPRPSDWCLVHNFSEAHRPRAIELPAGEGADFRTAMAGFVEELHNTLPAVFESEEYRNRRQSMDEEFRERQEQAFEVIQESGRERGVTLVRTPAGLALAPTREGEVITPDAFQALDEAERKQLQAALEELQEELQETIRQVPEWDRERRKRISQLNREVTMYAVGHLIDELCQKYEGHPLVLKYLEAVQADVLENVDVFLDKGEGQEQSIPGGPEAAIMAAAAAAGSGPGAGAVSPQRRPPSRAFRRYQVNLLVDNSAAMGAPVVYEDNPTYANLVGRVEHISEMGALITDFTLIKAGSLQGANGGYIIIDAIKLLTQPYAWEGLKRALRSRQVRIESLGQALSLISTISVEAEALPLDVKVVLIGEPRIYYLLCQADPEFGELFKVSVDYGADMERTPKSVLAYARLLGRFVRSRELKPFARSAVARLIEHSSRLAADQSRLSTAMGQINDIMSEADHWASTAKRRVVTAADIDKSVLARSRRHDRLRERSQEMIVRGTLMIDTAGKKVGQVNALSVLSLGDFSFGRPSRITARIRPGRGRVVDIEREVELGGPLHSKGVLILTSFLGARYAADRPLSLSASLVFEQSYGGIDGDSASSTELYALLSALSSVAIKQSLAVTGSVNQFGEVQAIGGVNEKIEGFFDLCRQRRLSGRQGVLIPAANVAHLMLRHDVVEACAKGRFQIYPVETIDDGIELLTGRPAGQRRRDGKFPEKSVNRLVEDRLIKMAEDIRAFARKGRGRAEKNEKAPEAP